MTPAALSKGIAVVMLMSGTRCVRRACDGAPKPQDAGDQPPATADSRRYLLERVDDAAVVQLYADGFASCR